MRFNPTNDNIIPIINFKFTFADKNKYDIINNNITFKGSINPSNTATLGTK